MCSRFGQSVRLLRPWFLRYIPRDGHPLVIDYIDTKPEVTDTTTKTIVILHNTPGSYYDFFQLISSFGKDYRVIIPNFPNFSHTIHTGGCFWHSAEEKSEFVVDLLRSLGVKRIDCLVAHSMATYTASFLWLYANQDDYFALRSICLLSPSGVKSIPLRQKARLKLVANAARLPHLRQWITRRMLQKQRESPLGPNLYSNYQMSTWKDLSLILSNYQTYYARLRELSAKQIPTLVTFSSNDKICPADVSYGQIYELNASEWDFDIYEQYENILVQSATDQSWIKVVDFRSAGHYMYNTHPDIVHSYIAELLDKVGDNETSKNNTLL